MNRIFTYFILLISFSVSIAAPAQTTIMLPASADNTIFSDNTQNSNGSGDNFTAGKTNGGSIRRALIKFDLSSIPPGSGITSVSLRLVMNKSRTGTDNISVYRMTKDWGEGASNAGNTDGQGVPAQVLDATWLCGMFDGAASCAPSATWASAGGDFVASASATTTIPNSPAAYTWSGATMVADVQGWVNNSITNFGWILRTNEASNQTANRFSSRTNPTAPDQPQLSVTYTAAAPVTLSSFRGAEGKTGILLDWETLSEFNNAYFLVQHSLDGVSFTTIGKVNGRGTSSSRNNYSLEHQGVSAGIHYYRLVQTDIDGVKHTSRVISVSAKNRHIGLVISPNPARDVVNMAFSGLIRDYRIYNNTGALVMSGKSENGQISVGQLSPGNYLIRVIAPSGETAVGSFQKR